MSCNDDLTATANRTVEAWARGRRAAELETPFLDLPDYGPWDADDIRAHARLIERLYATVWPGADIDGDSTPADLLLEHGTRVVEAVEHLRRVADAFDDEQEAHYRGVEAVECLRDLGAMGPA